MQSVIGEAAEIQSRLQLQRLNVKIFDADRSVIKSVAVYRASTLSPHRRVASVGYRAGARDVPCRLQELDSLSRELPLVWTINGEHARNTARS